MRDIYCGAYMSRNPRHIPTSNNITTFSNLADSHDNSYLNDPRRSLKSRLVHLFRLFPSTTPSSQTMNANQSPNNAQMTQSAEVSVQKVIQSELSQLKDTARVYYKQPNSNIFFLSSAEKEMNRSKKALDDLVKEYQQVQDGD